MNTKKTRTYSRFTKEAVDLLGKYIRLERKRRRFTEQDLADRIGISRATLNKIEKGDLKCEIGIVFEAAAIVGVKLFDIDSRFTLKAKLESANDKLSLLPKSIRKSPLEVDDAF